eukprot:6172460-Pleurochrysis_carterae.AAC.4
MLVHASCAFGNVRRAMGRDLFPALAIRRWESGTSYRRLENPASLIKVVQRTFFTWRYRQYAILFLLSSFASACGLYENAFNLQKQLLKRPGDVFSSQARSQEIPNTSISLALWRR